MCSWMSQRAAGTFTFLRHCLDFKQCDTFGMQLTFSDSIVRSEKLIYFHRKPLSNSLFWIVIALFVVANRRGVSFFAF
jgi:hypothetical protein